MALIRKCDICGCTITGEPAWYELTRKTAFLTKTLDICPECVARIKTEVEVAQKGEPE